MTYSHLTVEDHRNAPSRRGYCRKERTDVDHTRGLETFPGLLERLMQTVAPPFRGEVFYPPTDSP
jgi:hypothetical protein